MSDFFELKRLKRDLSDFLFGARYPHREGVQDDEIWALTAIDGMVRAHFSYASEKDSQNGFHVSFTLAGELIRFDGTAATHPLAVARAIAEARATFKTNETQVSLPDLL